MDEREDKKTILILVDGKGRESALGGKCECDREVKISIYVY